MYDCGGSSHVAKKSNAMTLKWLFRSMVPAWLILAGALLPAHRTYAQAADEPVQLAPDVHADVLRHEITTALSANDPARILSYIDEYHALGVEFPSDLLFVEAQAAETMGEAARALRALTLFMNKADRKSAPYQQAVTLYPAYAAAARSQTHSNAKQDDKGATLAPATVKTQADAEVKAVQARALENRPVEIAKFITEIKSELIPISGGKFQMGSYVDVSKASQHVHEVEVTPFRVTNAVISCQQYKIYAVVSGATPPEAWCDQIPKITWDQGKQFIAWLNQQSPLKFRMLSEAEWEWIAANRSGPEKVSVSGRVRAQRAGLGFQVQFSTSIAQPEWLADCWHATYKGAPSSSSAWTDGGDCARRVMRGASIPRQILHHQVGFAEDLNFYTYDDVAFVHRRTSGAVDQPCGGMDQCSIRLAADE